MKKVFFYAVLFAAVSMTFVACNKKKAAVESEEEVVNVESTEENVATEPEVAPQQEFTAPQAEEAEEAEEMEFVAAEAEEEEVAIAEPEEEEIDEVEAVTRAWCAALEAGDDKALDEIRPKVTELNRANKFSFEQRGRMVKASDKYDEIKGYK